MIEVLPPASDTWEVAGRIKRPHNYKLLVYLNTAEASVLTVPPSLLDEVIG